MTLVSAYKTRASADVSNQGSSSFQDIEERYSFVSSSSEIRSRSGLWPTVVVVHSTNDSSSALDFLAAARLVLRGHIAHWNRRGDNPGTIITSQMRLANLFESTQEESGQNYQPDSSSGTVRKLTSWQKFEVTFLNRFADPLGIRDRLLGFKNLEDGWADGMQPASEWGQGYGKALDADGIDWLLDAFRSGYGPQLPRPYLYPTPAGGVQAEWSLGSFEVSLTIDLFNHTAEWYSLNLDTDEDESRDLSLEDNSSWIWLAGQLHRLEASSR